MTKKILYSLPGAVCKQSVKCGKPRCRCVRGEKHGVYWFRFWWEGGKLKKEYIKAADVAYVKRACAAYRKEKQEQREAVRLFSHMVQMLRARGL